MKEFLYAEKPEPTPYELVERDMFYWGRDHWRSLSDTEFLMRYGISKQYFKSTHPIYRPAVMDPSDMPPPFTKSSMEQMMEGMRQEALNYLSAPKIAIDNPQKKGKKKTRDTAPLRTSVRPSQLTEKQKRTNVPEKGNRQKTKLPTNNKKEKGQDPAELTKKAFQQYKKGLLRNTKGKIGRTAITLAEKAMKREMEKQSIDWGTEEWHTIVQKYFPSIPHIGPEKSSIPNQNKGADLAKKAKQDKEISQTARAKEHSKEKERGVQISAQRKEAIRQEPTKEKESSQSNQAHPSPLSPKKETSSIAGQKEQQVALATENKKQKIGQKTQSTAKKEKTTEKQANTNPTPLKGQEAKTTEKKELSAKDRKKLIGEDTKDIIKNISSTAPTEMLNAYKAGASASNEALKKETKEAQESIPKIQAPRGIAPKTEVPTKKEEIKKFAKSEPKDTKPKAQTEQKKESKEQSLFGNLFSAIKNIFSQKQEFKDDIDIKIDKEKGVNEGDAEAAIDNIDLDSDKVPTEMGTSPGVELKGTADPSQMQDDKAKAQEEAQQAQLEAIQYKNNDFGESGIYPEKDDTILKAKTQLASAGQKATEQANSQQEIPPELLAETDKLMGTEMLPKIKEKEAEYLTANENYEKDREQAHRDSEKEIEQLQAETSAQQKAEKEKVNQEINSQKEAYQKEVRQLDQDFKRQAKEASQDTGKQINSEKKKGEAKAQQHFEEAEEKAEKEKTKAEAKAQKKKDETKKEKKGFWGRLKDAVSSVINAVKEAVNTIFEGLRSLVKGIFEAAKKLAMAAIDLATKAITSLIKAFGAILKGFIKVMFAAFPKLQQKLLNAVDKAVNKAVEKVQKFAEGLKKAVAKALDFLASVIDTLLGTLQEIYNIAFTAIGMIVRGEFAELGKYLAKSAVKLVVGTLKSFLDLLGIDTSTLDMILDDPIQFLKNLLSAIKGGIKNFVANIKQHLMNGLAGWLFGTMSEAGISLPDRFDLKGIIFLVLQLLNLTWDAIKVRISKQLGPKGEAIMEKAEQVAGLVKDVIENGPMAIVDRIKDYVSDLRETLFGSIIEWVRNTIITKAITKLIASLNPAGAILTAIQGIYDTVMFFIERWEQIKDFCQAVMKSIKAIAKGDIDTAKGWVEGSLAKAIPITISFLARLIGLGGIAQKVKKVIKKIRKPIDKAINKVIKNVVGKLKKIGNSILGKGKKGLEKGKEKVKNSFAAIVKWWKKKRKFKNKTGESHTIFYKGKGKTAKLMIASVPKPILEFLEKARSNPENKNLVSSAEILVKKIEILENEYNNESDGNKKVPIEKEHDKYLDDLKGICEKMGWDSSGWYEQTDAKGFEIPPEYAADKNVLQLIDATRKEAEKRYNIKQSNKHKKKEKERVKPKGVNLKSPVLTGVIDPVDGNIKFFDNYSNEQLKNKNKDSRKTDFELFVDQMHPFLKIRYHKFMELYEDDRVLGSKKHLSRAGVPGYHSEIRALDFYLKQWEIKNQKKFEQNNLGEEYVNNELKRIMIHNRSLLNTEQVPPRCIVCWNLTKGITVIGND